MAKPSDSVQGILDDYRAGNLSDKEVTAALSTYPYEMTTRPDPVTEPAAWYDHVSTEPDQPNTFAEVRTAYYRGDLPPAVFTKVNEAVYTASSDEEAKETPAEEAAEGSEEKD